MRGAGAAATLPVLRVCTLPSRSVRRAPTPRVAARSVCSSRQPAPKQQRRKHAAAAAAALLASTVPALQVQALELPQGTELQLGGREALAGLIVLVVRATVFKIGIEGVNKNVEEALAKCERYGIPTDDLYQQTDPQILWYVCEQSSAAPTGS